MFTFFVAVFSLFYGHGQSLSAYIFGGDRIFNKSNPRYQELLKCTVVKYHPIMLSMNFDFLIFFGFG